MFAHPLRGASTLPALLALVGFALVPAASAQSQDYQVLGLSVGEEKCKWSYAVCYPLPCDNTNLVVKLCGSKGPAPLAGPSEWTQVIKDEIDDNVPNFSASRFQVGVDWFVRITGPEPFHFFVGPCQGICDPPDDADMNLVGTNEVVLGGGGGGATIKRVPGGGGRGPVPPAVYAALVGLLGLAGLWLLRRKRSAPASAV